MSTAAATPPSWHHWSRRKPHGHFCLLSETVTSSCISHQPVPPHIWALLKCQSCSGQRQVGKTVFFLCYTWLEKQMPCCLSSRSNVVFSLNSAICFYPVSQSEQDYCHYQQSQNFSGFQESGHFCSWQGQGEGGDNQPWDSIPPGHSGNQLLLPSASSSLGPSSPPLDHLYLLIMQEALWARTGGDICDLCPHLFSQTLETKICLQCRFDPWVGKIPWRRKWQPTPVFLPGDIPWTEEPSRLQSMELQKSQHNWATN